MYFFVFLNFCFYCFFGRNLLQTFLKHNYTKIDWLKPLKLKIWIFIWINWKNTFYIGFVHEITFLSNFGLDEFFSKGRGDKTVRAGVTNLVSKVARYLKEKSHETSRRELVAVRRYCAKRRGGDGGFRPPTPSLIRVKD